MSLSNVDTTIKAIKESVVACPYLRMVPNASTTDDGFFIILSLRSRSTEITKQITCSRFGHGCPKMTLDSALRGKTAFRRGRSYGHCQSNLNKTSRSGKVHCIVDSCLHISSVESGFWNMFLQRLSVSVLVLRSHSTVTGISQPDYSAIHQKRY